MALLSLEQVSVAFGGPPVLDAVEAQVHRGERVALLGRNGAGKSTLLGVLAGQVEPDHGRLVLESGVTVGLLPQTLPRELGGSVRDLVSGGVTVPPSDRRRVEAAISRVGLNADQEIATLSAGMLRRALLARALAPDPDVLLLDEPTNHLDVASIEWLEAFLLRQATTLLFVTHDRAFLRRLATRILDLDRGHLTSWPGDYDVYVERREAQLRTEARAQAHFDKVLAGEEEWVRQGVKERRKRNMGRVRELERMRQERAARRARVGTVALEAQSATPSGRLVAEARSLTYAWGKTPIVTDLSTTILRGDRVGILGPNGSGKTTLLQLLLGELKPDAGRLRLGTNLEVAYFDQRHASLDDTKTAMETVCPVGEFVTVNGRKRHAIGYLSDFLFTADQARSPVYRFSGGERNRLLLAKILARPSNVLVLDEPTNDLDLETLDRLEELLLDYEGTILLVSHDRSFLDSVVTSTLVLEGGGLVTEHAGGYSDWRRTRDAAEAARSRAQRSTKRPPPKQTAPSALTKAERKELAELPQRIEELEARRAALHVQMADPEFYRRGGTEIADATRDLEDLDGQVAESWARWESLEAKRHAR